MSDAVRMQFDSEGNVVDTSLEAAMKAEAATPAPAPRQAGPMRLLFNTDTGETTVQESRPRGARVSPSAEKATARNAQGMPVSLATAGPKDIITLPNGLGDSSAETWEQLGMLRRLPGGGYEAIGEQATPQQQQQPDKPKVEEPTGDASNVPGTSQEVDSFQTDLAKRSPAGFDGLITSLVRTGEMPTALVADLARQSGQESAAFAANVQRMTGEYVAAGRAALSNVGVTQPEVFERWARAERPDAFDSAVRDLVNGKSVASMQSLGRKFVAANNEKLASLIQSHGVDTEVRDGQVYVSRRSLGLPPTPKVGDFGGSDSMLLRDAIRAGHITITQ
jgi:hypothetical protein